MLRRSQLYTIALSLLLCGAIAFPASAQCLSYEPEVVHLVGVLRRHVHAGPPNYDSVSKGDKPEIGYYLHLNKPICTIATSDVDSQQGVRVIQLVLTDNSFRRLKRKHGRRVKLTGALSAAHSGHHHAPLILTVADPQAAKD